MLRLKNIVKNYTSGGSVVPALRDVSIDFRDSDFCAVLGHSGCGKTTLLNIIGGLDKYTSGDLTINGRSTKGFGDRDWDAYRNHSIGFVFQSYNLIPHQTVLSNVELALTLSGVSKSERKRRAKEALERVGLHDQIHKRPNQLSGGQMQRVAIARALVNDPAIILADEPTGALDTETSVQVMDILKTVAEDRLVIMVTHNPELAEKYATRTIKMVDGKIISDSRPLTDEEYAAGQAREARLLAERKAKKKKEKKPSMSFGTSFMLSLRNLFTKRGRTVLTSFAGSIGIIGIALIIAVSQGMTNYINAVQESTLSTYPLTIMSETVDMTSLIESFMGGKDAPTHENDAVYKDQVIAQLVNALSEVEANKNDLKAFREFIEAELADENSDLFAAVNGISYTYDLDIPIYTENVDGEIIKSDTGELVSEMLVDFMAQLAQSDSPLSQMGSSSGSISTEMMGSMMGLQMWEELLPGLDGAPVNDLILDQYEVVHGDWPKEKNEIILVLDKNNELDDLTLYALGLLPREEIEAIIKSAANGEALPESEKTSWSYEEICDMTFRTIMPYDAYKEIGDSGVYMNVLDYDAGTVISNPVELLYEDAFELKVVGIVRPNENADVAMLTGTIGYTRAFTEYVIESAKESDVVKAQLADPSIDVLTGLPFKSNTDTMNDADKSEAFGEYVEKLTQKSKAEAFFKIACLAAYDEGLEAATDQMIGFMVMDRDKNGDGGKGELMQTISSMISAEADMDASMVLSYLDKLTVDELKELIRPTIEEQAKKQIDAKVEAGLAMMSEEMRAAALDTAMEDYTEAERARYYDEITEFSENTYEKTLATIGCVDLETPYTINIFASTFENRDAIIAAIDEYNETVPEAKKISNTDYLGIMMDSVTIIINAISYVLIAFVSISLVVSSIMIGVITLISVQERTKEIGILRAIGASKRNVSSMFNAETIIVGAAAGLLGVLITYLLCIPINAILYSLTGIANLRAVLPVGYAAILVAISIVLTMFAGLIPSKSAAKKDPVVALRTE
ncbi:MAG: ABC transporter ATP-binding protein/permease [Ruminococcaceae bacterium]|nr:ABC transporter ATP-binding protein/permease [Oscillospiraceae bacterium]